MSDSGSRSSRVTVRKILSLEKRQEELEIADEQCHSRNLGLAEVHSPRGRQYDPPNLRGPHNLTLTEKGRAFQLEVHALRKQEVEKIT